MSVCVYMCARVTLIDHLILGLNSLIQLNINISVKVLILAGHLDLEQVEFGQVDIVILKTAHLSSKRLLR